MPDLHSEHLFLCCDHGSTEDVLVKSLVRKALRAVKLLCGDSNWLDLLPLLSPFDLILALQGISGLTEIILVDL